MAVTHNTGGFTGTVDQIDEARRLAIAGGGRFRVSTSGSWTPTASTGTRAVNIAAGTAVACGVLDDTTAAEALTFAANSSGADRFDAVVASFDWSSMTVSFGIIQGTSVPPAVLNSGTTVDTTKINWLPGWRYDAVLAIIRVRSGVTVLAPADLYDCRPWGDWGQINVNSSSYLGQVDSEYGRTIRDSSGHIYTKQTDGSWKSNWTGYLYSITSAATGTVGTTSSPLLNVTVTIPDKLSSDRRVKITGGVFMATNTGIGSQTYLANGSTTLVNRQVDQSGSYDAVLVYYDSDLTAGSRTYTVRAACTTTSQVATYRSPHIEVEIV